MKRLSRMCLTDQDVRRWAAVFEAFFRMSRQLGFAVNPARMGPNPLLTIVERTTASIGGLSLVTGNASA